MEPQPAKCLMIHIHIHQKHPCKCWRAKLKTKTEVDLYTHSLIHTDTLLLRDVHRVPREIVKLNTHKNNNIDDDEGNISGNEIQRSGDFF